MPFTIQPAEGPTFIDREEELKDVLTTLRDPSSTMGFALYGKRRCNISFYYRGMSQIIPE